MLQQSLQKILPAKRVRTRLIDRIAYSTDASFYQLIPKAVVHPTSIEEIRDLFAWSKEYRIPLTFRAAGSSLSGQAVTEGVIVDITRSFKNIQVEKNGGLVRLGTAVRGGYANTILKKYGVKIGPDPASINTCMIGGIVANNASGMCCGTVQNSYHTLHSMTFMLTNGLVIDSSESNADARLMEHAPDIANGIMQLKREILDSPQLVERIRSKYRIKNTMGYSLNAFLDYESPVDILQHLLVGSEGTLAFIAEVVFHTVPAYAHAYTGLLSFPSIEDACRAINPLRDSGAAALELMDRFALRSVEHFSDTPQWIASLGDEECALLVEYQFPQEDELHNVRLHLHDALTHTHLSRSPIFTSDTKEQALYWKIRKGMMPTIGAMRPSGSCLVNEDVAFKPGDLANGVRDVRALMQSEGYPDGIIFGHAKDGNMHFILPKHIRTDEQLRHYERFMDRLADLIVGKYDGSLKAEHSTGRNMAPYVELEWGSEAYTLMRRLKQLLDPDGILNPDVIISDDKKIHTKNIKLLPTIEVEVDRCIECGFCESHCPSRELTLTPRQRIGVRRQMQRYVDLRAEKELDELEQDIQYDVLDTCAVDGLCATACPVGINTGDFVKGLRSEKHTTSAEKMALWCAEHIVAITTMLRVATGTARWGSKLIGKASVEKLSAFASSVFGVPTWQRQLGSGVSISPCSSVGDAYVYFHTCTSRIMGKIDGSSQHEVFLRLCEKANISIRIAEDTTHRCCGNAFASKGYTQAHTAALNAFIESMYTASDEGRLPVVIDNSSCTYAVLSSASHLDAKHKAMYDAMQFLDLSRFIDEIIAPLLLIEQKKQKVILHPTCADRKMNTVPSLLSVAQRCASEVVIPHNAGCCGFAGDRGLLFPELTKAATKDEAEEVLHYDAQGYYSSNYSCQVALSKASEKNYQSIVFLVDEAVSTVTSLKEKTRY